ncbi:hypothetical protein KIH87_07665 [Paraneptunicella aestuarii]|uniref:hypothetical protein n=1 Tax=Paraneptunicella aestuarii TaxID=2831148 RepID=UPI001E2F4D6D|nr:hypothetical protein [Paraneptunicella aestuarii]UAA40206.1 hypothetical protein KIH87_07665 [Paraneptunicella aestuarii]
MFTIVIILIVTLIVLAIMINAIQQHKEKVEAERRTEIAKQKSIVDETENVLLASGQIPVSPNLALIMHKRIYNALKIILELNPKAADIKQRVKESSERINNITPSPAEVDENITLPDNDKQIILCIQSLKKLRALLRSEHSKGKVDTQTFIAEDKRLDRMQLRVNVDTLYRRADSAIKSQMMGSARQYLEKAIIALSNFPAQDEYTKTKKAHLEQLLNQIQENLRNSNAEDAARRLEKEKDELDVLFAPKKKW